MLAAAGSPLVSGGRNPDKTMSAKSLRIRVLRPFLLRLERQDVGQEIEVDRPLAMELASSNKAEILRPASPTDTPAPAVVADTKPAAPAKAGPRKEA